MKHPILKGIAVTLLATAISYVCIDRGMAVANAEPAHDQTIKVNLQINPKTILGWDDAKSIVK